MLEFLINFNFIQFLDFFFCSENIIGIITLFFQIITLYFFDFYDITDYFSVTVNLLCLVVIPFFSFLILFFFSSFFPPSYFTKYHLIKNIVLSCIIIVFGLCCLYALKTYILYALNGYLVNLQCGLWFDFGLLIVSWGFYFDPLTFSMICVVFFISFLVNLYSLSYMQHDFYQMRFFSYLSLFTFFMLILVTANNFFQLFLGWEGVGLCSYLLISFWYTRIQAVKSAIKAMVVNRVGDFALLFAIALIFYLYRTINYLPLFILIPYTLELYQNFFGFVSYLDLICIFLFIGAVGKSAQIGLHTWLPDAMEGPTPVSALIHAATMVTAGVFLLIRCSFFFEYSEISLLLILLIGSLTAFFSSTIGLVQHDIKKIIAYSTCSQLGYMILACGLSNYNLALFHLVTHAFFKALLFLTAGSIIHSVVDEQDIRKMGGLQRILPISYAALLIGSLALTGFPFLAGYYSKDYIMESVFVSNTSYSYILYILVVLIAFFTSIYSLRILFLVFFTKTNISRGAFSYISESSWIICSVLIILCIFSIFSGYFLFDIYAGFGSLFLSNSILILPQHYYQQYSEFLPIFIKLIPLFLGFFVIFLFFFIYYFFFSIIYDFKFKYLFIYRFLIKKWFFDIFFNKNFVLPLYYFGYNITYRLIDKGILELIGPRGLTLLLTQSCRLIHKSFFFFSLSFNFLLIIFWFICCLCFFIFFH